MLRRPVLGLAYLIGISLLLPATSSAQIAGSATSGVDPFASYYGFYLPNQAYQAAQTRVEDTINAITVVRQQNAMAQRNGLYDARSRFDIDEDQDLFRPYAPTRRGERAGGLTTTNVFGGNVRGTGPPLYYNRTARYFPTLKQAHGPNRNLMSLRTRGAGAGIGGMGLPGMSIGAGPR